MFGMQIASNGSDEGKANYLRGSDSQLAKEHEYCEQQVISAYNMSFQNYDIPW